MKLKETEDGSEKLKGKYIYLLSPVRKVTPDQAEKIATHAKYLKESGAILFNPVEDAHQQDATGYNIVMAELNFLYKAAKNGGRVDVLWNAGGDPSEGSRVDVGMALALGLELNLVEVFNAENPSGPQQGLAFMCGWGGEAVKSILEKIRKSDVVIVDWDMEMKTEEQELQRICLGMALGEMVQNPNIKIKLGDLNGIDPPEKKSYVKVMREIMARQIAGEN